MRHFTKSDRIPYKELKKKILSCELPETQQLCQGSFICDVQKFLKIEFSIIEHNPGKRIALPSYDRLLQFYLNIQNKR